MKPQTQRQRTTDMIGRAIERSHMVGGFDNLPDAGKDAFLLAMELRDLQITFNHLTRKHENLVRAIRSAL